jgi:hypothetical protein
MSGMKRRAPRRQYHRNLADGHGYQREATGAASYHGPAGVAHGDPLGFVEPGHGAAPLKADK